MQYGNEVTNITFTWARVPIPAWLQWMIDGVEVPRPLVLEVLLISRLNVGDVESRVTITITVSPFTGPIRRTT